MTTTKWPAPAASADSSRFAECPGRGARSGSSIAEPAAACSLPRPRPFFGRRFGAIPAVALLLLFAGAASPAGAQPRRQAAIGSFVRVSTEVDRTVGTLVGSDDEALRILVEGASEPVRIFHPAVVRLERRRPATTGERAFRGAAWGVAVGAVYALSLAMAFDSVEPDVLVKAPFVFAPWAGGIGAIIGVAIPQSRWDRVAAPRPSEPIVGYSHHGHATRP